MPGTPRAGDAPGTERWIVMLRGRDRAAWRDRLTMIRAETDPVRRRTMVTALPALARSEQEGFARGVAAAGGRVVRSFWTLQACTVEVTRPQLAQLRGLAAAVAFYPDEIRRAASATHGLLPMDVARNADNHAVDAAQALLTNTDKGAGANIAFFDTGVDEDQSGTGTGGQYGPDPDPHSAFTGRLIHQQQLGSIDCNSVPPDPYCPATSSHPRARHGTGVAGVAAGREEPTVPPALPKFYAGHAEGAGVLSFSITDLAGLDWVTDETKYLAAVESLQTWMLEEKKPVHVLNISFDGWPDPQHPTQQALDVLERDFDVLVITSAGNDFDATFTSNGFVNGLSVGNVHKWGSTLGRYPHRASARGPLVDDPERRYPDVVATGSAVNADRDELVSQVQMPLIDYRYTPTGTCRGTGMGQTNYNAAGTSMAAPQVAGAATLYRAHRTGATALEAKAAILLTTIDPLAGSTLFGTLPSRHTYEDRNMVGEGYVRDDLLARYARRFDDAQGWAITLTPSAAEAVVTLPTPASGEHYAVAIAWPRVFPSEGEFGDVPWAQVDLEVRMPGPGSTGMLLARSDSLRNTYERVVFRGNGSTAEIHVKGIELHGQAVPVYVAARRLTAITLSGAGSVLSRMSIPGFVQSIPQDAACNRSVADETVSRVLPPVYAGAWGSLPKLILPTDPSTTLYWGDRLSLASDTSPRIIDTLFAADQIGGAITIRGLAVRSWKGLNGGFGATGGTLVIEDLRLYQPGVFDHRYMPSWNGLNNAGTNPPVTATVVANRTFTIHDPKWNARRWDTWPVIIPFDTGQSFTVNPALPLGVWIKVSPSSTANLFVDGVADGGAVPYMSNLDPAAPLGRAMIFGVIEGSTQTLSPALDVYGFPRIGEDVLFQVRSAGAGAIAVVELGFSNPGTLVGQCRRLTSTDFTPPSLPASTTSVLGDATVPFLWPNDPALLHRHVFAQAVITSGSSTTYTNGIRLTLGGIVP